MRLVLESEVGPAEVRPLLSYSEWLTSSDVQVLLRHCVPLISRQHLSLVLAELALDAWPCWHAVHPEDWRPAWSLAALVGWCLGESNADEARAARQGAWEARMRWGQHAKPGDKSSFGAYCAAYAAAVAAAYVADSPANQREADDDWVENASSREGERTAFWAAAARDPIADARHRAARDAASRMWSDDSPAGKVYAEAAAEALELADEALQKRKFSEAADLVRRLVPYPARVSLKWRVQGALVVAGDAELHLDDWRVVRARARGGGRPLGPAAAWN